MIASRDARLESGVRGMGSRSTVGCVMSKAPVEKGTRSPASRTHQTQKRGHTVQLIDVIRTRVAGESKNAHPLQASLAQLLHAAGSPAQHRLAGEAKRSDEVVGRLGRTGERAWEYF